MILLQTRLGSIISSLFLINELSSRIMADAVEEKSLGKHKVFVYGTLKKNLPNHDYLLDKIRGKSTFIGDGYTTDKFPLVVASRYHIPCLLFVRNVGHQVKGELYEVDDQMLENLDKLEEHPHFYERVVEPIQLHSKDKNSTKTETVEAWIYFIKKMNAQLLEEPYLTDYQNSDEKKKYVASEDESSLDDLLRSKRRYFVKHEIGSAEGGHITHASGQKLNFETSQLSQWERKKLSKE